MTIKQDRIAQHQALLCSCKAGSCVLRDLIVLVVAAASFGSPLERRGHACRNAVGDGTFDIGFSCGRGCVELGRELAMRGR
jgi:hypothetical protein